ncbi:hypothetical protein ACTFIR_004169 [Dictyostelium discoideum]
MENDNSVNDSGNNGIVNNSNIDYVNNDSLEKAINNVDNDIVNNDSLGYFESANNEVDGANSIYQCISCNHDVNGYHKSNLFKHPCLSINNKPLQENIVTLDEMNKALVSLEVSL